MESEWVVLDLRTQNSKSADARDGILLPVTTFKYSVHWGWNTSLSSEIFEILLGRILEGGVSAARRIGNTGLQPRSPAKPLPQFRAAPL